MRGCERSIRRSTTDHDFDFDMIMMIYPESDLPGNELRDYFTCAASKAQGSFDTPGVCDPAVDVLVERWSPRRTGRR